MCGICLIFNTDGEPPQKPEIERMVQAIKHRGPDAQNCMIRDNVALGHARLSIVDIKGGAQPMQSPDGRYAISYNGEIYNYQSQRIKLESNGIRFHSRCDTEVVLQLYIRYKEACVEHLIGMFSFAIHDKLAGKLFIARDRLGIKPLFYHWDGRRLYCASEMKGLFASGSIEPEFDPNSIQNYFTYQFSVPPYTPFKSILELPPGHTLSIESGCEPQIKQYWDLEFPSADDYEDIAEKKWLQRFETALHDITQSHMIGEVPIAAYLSGGIDSSATTFLLNQYYKGDLQAFTIKFSNPANDESEISARIAAHLGVAADEVVLDDQRPEGYLSALVKALYYVEQPQRMVLDVPFYLLSRMVREFNYKVVYTGDGADEILAGYDCYRQDQIRIRGNRYQDESLRLDSYVNEYRDYFAEQHMRMLFELHRPQRQQNTIAQFGCYPAWNDFWHILDDKMTGLFSHDFASQLNANTQMTEAITKFKPRIEGLDPLNQSLYLETKTRLPGWILWKSDRMSMANSVEARVPFMDHTLVELAARVPPILKLNGMDEKYILRKIIMPELPEHPTGFKKRAFYTPIREWFFTHSRKQDIQRYISAPALEEAGIFNPQTVQKHVDELLSIAAPTSIDDYYYIMKLEWLLLSVLSIQILHELYIKKQSACFVGLNTT